jgi:hypothetical protein
MLCLVKRLKAARKAASKAASGCLALLVAAVVEVDDGKIDAATGLVIDAGLVLQPCTVLFLLALAALAAGVSVFCPKP